jgi:hypothetical protein
MICSIPRKEAQQLFDGILAGDGDIYGRMASSHPDARPAYPEPLGLLIPLLYDSLNSKSPICGKGHYLAESFLKNLIFIDD